MVALNEEFVWNAVIAHLPSKSSTSRKGFVNINCPMCVRMGQPRADTRQRCGIKQNPEGVGVNCFAAGTMVTTDQGTLAIEHLVGRTVKVIDANGEWAETMFKSYGKQQLYRLTLSRSQRTKIIYTTAGHRWLLKKGRELTTQELKPNHYLRGVAIKPQFARLIVKEGVKHGFIYGDGSLSKNITRANFCSTDKEALLSFFTEHQIAQYAHYKSALGCDPSYKTLPCLDSDPDYIFSFLAGYFAADGCVGTSKPSSATISCADEKVLHRIRDLFTKVGITTYEPRAMRSDAPGRYKDSPIWQMTLMRSSIPEHFFLNQKHRANMESNPGQTYDRLGWKVVSVEVLDRVEEVYCCEVATTQSFVLQDNLLTGNCFNCGFNTRYIKGELLSKKFKDFLRGLGLTDFEVTQINYKAFQAAEQGQSAKGMIKIAPAFVPAYNAVPLPRVTKSISEWLEEGCIDSNFLEVAEYALGRGPHIFKEAMWSTDAFWHRRMIIPCRFRDAIVGYSGRVIDKVKTGRYINEVPADFIYNNEVLRRYERKYILLVEGMLDALAIDGISPFGAKLSDNQISWIKSAHRPVIVLPDPDKSGGRLIDKALENNWSVAFPHVDVNGDGWWEHDCKDAAEAVRRYGRLYTIRSILETATDNQFQIEVKKKWLIGG